MSKYNIEGRRFVLAQQTGWLSPMGDMYPCCYHDHVAEAIEAEQNSTNTEIEVLKTEIERNRHVLKSIANLIEESI